MTEKEKKMKKLADQQKACRAMATAAKKRGDGLLETFYTNAAKGYGKKLLREQVI